MRAFTMYTYVRKCDFFDVAHTPAPFSSAGVSVSAISKKSHWLHRLGTGVWFRWLVWKEEEWTNIRTQIINVMKNYVFSEKLTVIQVFWKQKPFLLVLFAVWIVQSIVQFQQNPSVEINGNFWLLGVWKMKFQYKFDGNQHSQ